MKPENEDDKVIQIPGTEREDNVIELDGETTLDIPVERVISGALEKDLETVIVLGWNEEGEMYLASSTGSRPNMYYLLDSAKVALMLS